MAIKVKRSIRTAVVAAVSTGCLLGASTAYGATLAPASASTQAAKSTAPAAYQTNTPMGWDLTTHTHTTPSVRAVAADSGDLQGLDVSSYQGDVDWSTVASDGASFAYIKATQDTDYTNPDFDQQYEGAYNAGLIRGSYDFAVPNSSSSAAAQAQYFVDNGGGWSSDGKTLPGALDIEYNPSGDECYDLTQSAMVTWVSDWVNEYYSLEGVYPVIYSTNDWWSTCTGDTSDFSNESPLWLADYNSTPGTIPGNWGYQTIWQYADSGTFPGDQDEFNGSQADLQALATNG